MDLECFGNCRFFFCLVRIEGSRLEIRCGMVVSEVEFLLWW